MEIAVLAPLLVVVLFAALAAGLWIGFALIAVGLVAMLAASTAPVTLVFATKVWGSLTVWDLTSLPMFIWMGEILVRSRLSSDMFEGLAPFTRRLPGRLLHVNVLGCALFAAVSGSSAATTATIGRMSIPELTARGYDPKMAIGTLAGAGTFGFLIPPSIILIVYGAATEQSIAQLFLAGLVPGVMLAAMFSGYIMIWAMLNPTRMPDIEPAVNGRDSLRALARLLPVVGLIIAVIGSIYAGIASPTEAAVIGVVGAMILAWATGAASWRGIGDSLMAASTTTCMIAFIMAGAGFLTVAMGYTGIPRALAAWIGAMDLSPYALLAALTVFFIIMGMFLDGISIVVLTVSIILPMVTAVGLDPIWFGVFLVIVVEMSQITPPVGFNLFVLQKITGRDILQLAGYALPFFLILVAAVALLSVFPQIALWLPRTM
ncbi:Sialic acid TRAP transporter permease protein SiaT [Pseudooceanicola marinus]|uniref:TRAP transporter large permease protein n=1 Tax=Pseudooceanicola marinus TaxID=396013 RepID=A0A1X6YAB0_9RHOB|nr:TRAP transporter large permease subunit [Pseudooceanicola marinus]PJE33095.1 C4-dicarboxylate ABC transporter permease [Pseudooceanicola marinus]SLN15209.1 Sialic acid TRAP transporter permease protein SiaT [Pseudooceanicola marinus]